jgi:hypothetical protein
MLQSESDGAFVADHRSNALFTGWPHCRIGSSLGGSILMIVCPQDRQAIAYKMAPRRNVQSQLFYVLMKFSQMRHFAYLPPLRLPLCLIAYSVPRIWGTSNKTVHSFISKGDFV